MVTRRKPVWLAAVLLVFIMSCVPSATVSKQETPEQFAFKTINLAFDLYDLGMTTAATLHRTKVITTQQWTQVKDTGRVLWKAIQSAEAAAENYAKAKSTDPQRATLFGEMDRAITAMLGSKKEFLSLVEAVQKGGTQ